MLVPQGRLTFKQNLPCGIYAEHFWQAVKGPQPTFAGLFCSSFKNETPEWGYAKTAIGLNGNKIGGGYPSNIWHTKKGYTIYICNTAN